MSQSFAQCCTNGGRRLMPRAGRWVAVCASLAIAAPMPWLPLEPLPRAGVAEVQPVLPGPAVVGTGKAALPAPLADAAKRLTAPGGSLSERAGAARRLLVSRHPAAMAALGDVITAPPQPDTRRAVLQAVAMSDDQPPQVLVQPISALLGQVDPSMRADWGAAVGRFDDPRLMNQLTQTAQNTVADQSRRIDAIVALGYDRTQRTARNLITLMDKDPAEAIQSAACHALGTLTGLDQPGTDREAWRQWWRDAGRDSSLQWERHLRANFARRATARHVRQQQLVGRLIESQKTLYRATSAEDRPAVLTYMLGDPLESIRSLGMDLALRRLLDGSSFSKPLLQAVRTRLTDPSDRVRQRAVLLLRDLLDKPAAKTVAQRLAQGQETVTAVLRADLKMMARMPQAVMVDSAYDLMEDPTLRPDAAGALAAGAEQGVLTKRQVALALRRVRDLTRGHSPPAPQLVTLLAKVGEDRDWQRIAGWINSKNPRVKQAAAEAWAQSDHSLRQLARLAGDPVIQPIVIAAAIQRGNDSATLQALAAHRPEQAQARQSWERALVATARRVPIAAVLSAAMELKKTGADPTLRESVITAALSRVDDAAAVTTSTSVPTGTIKPIDAPAGQDLQDAQDISDADLTAQTRAVAGLLLQRGHVRLDQGNAAEAAEDFARLTNLAGLSDKDHAADVLAPDQRAELYRGEVRCYLLTSDVDKAFASARRLLGRDQGAQAPTAAATEDPIVDQFLQAAKRMSTLNHDAQARQVLQKLRLLLGPRIKPEIAQRIAVLQAKIQGRTLPESVPGSESADTGNPTSRAPSPPGGA